MTFDRESGVYEALRRDLRKFTPLPQPDTAGAGESILGGGGGAPTIFIAASDASDLSKSKADMVCVGSGDQAVIVAAFAELTALGARVFLSEGTFNISAASELFVPSGKTLEGMGAGNVVSGGTHLVWTGTAASGAAFLEMQGGATVRNLTMKDSDTGTGFTVDAGTGSGLTILENVRILSERTDAAISLSPSDIYVRGSLIESDWDGIWNSSERSYIHDNYILAGRVNVELRTGAKEVHVLHNSLVALGKGVATDASGATGVNDLEIRGNVIAGGDTEAVFLDTSTRVVIADNIIKAANVGVLLDTVTEAAVVNNVIADAVEHGIQLTDSSDNLVAGNQIYRLGQTTTNTYDGILLDGNSDRNAINDNSIISDATTKARYGINVSAATCDNNRVGDNDYGVLTDYGTHPLNDAGTGTRYPTAVRAVMSVGGALADATVGASRYPIHEPSIFLDAYATVDTAPSGSAAVFDVNKNVTTMYGTATNPQVAAAANVGTIAPADATLLANGDILRVDVDTASSAEDAVIIARFLVG